MANNLTIAGAKRLIDTKIRNVASKSFGVVVLDQNTGQEVVANLIEREQRVPKKITSTFGTSAEGQIEVDIRVIQSEICVGAGNTFPFAADNLDPAGAAEGSSMKKIGSAQVTFGSPLPEGSPIEVCFHLLEDGRLKVHAKDLTTGGDMEAEYVTDGVMTKEELAKARSQALSMKVSSY